jgi:hypothetical protein
VALNILVSYTFLNKSGMRLLGVRDCLGRETARDLVVRIVEQSRKINHRLTKSRRFPSKVGSISALVLSSKRRMVRRTDFGGQGKSHEIERAYRQRWHIL